MIICPSNPLLSIDPILAVADIRARITNTRSPVIAVSPIVGGQAVKGPAAKILQELGREPSALSIARHYADIADGIIIDDADCDLAPSITALGLAVHVTQTVMRTSDDQTRLALHAVDFARKIGHSRSV